MLLAKPLSLVLAVLAAARAHAAPPRLVPGRPPRDVHSTDSKWPACVCMRVCVRVAIVFVCYVCMSRVSTWEVCVWAVCVHVCVCVCACERVSLCA